MSDKLFSYITVEIGDENIQAPRTAENSALLSMLQQRGGTTITRYHKLVMAAVLAAKKRGLTGSHLWAHVAHVAHMSPYEAQQWWRDAGAVLERRARLGLE